MQPVQTVGVLLAAGLGTRFDPAQPGRKLEVLIDGGMSVAERSLLALSDAVDAVVVATRTAESPVASIAQHHGAQVVVSEYAHLGMGHSLAAGVEAALRRFPDARWLVVALADMPWVKSATIRSLIEKAVADDCIVQSCCDGQRGHPVVFPARYTNELVRCSGDVGAREVLRAHAQEVFLMDVSDAGVLRDVDTPKDLAGPPPA